MPAPSRRPRRRVTTTLALLTGTPLALTALTATPAAAHGTMGDPVSRVAQCYAEGPESPKSAACKAAVATGGTQALYDWNGIRIGDAAGRHQTLIPDGKLCSADNDEFKGLDLARADWPTTSVKSGAYTFKYRVTAPHKGTFKVYVTKSGYDPAGPLAWKDLDLDHPVATATDPAPVNGFYTFSGTLPQRSGKHLLYAIWQRSDSPEAFYSCSDVDFGGSGTANSDGNDDSGSADAAPAPAASAPTDQQIAAGTDKSTIEHHGHGDQDADTSAAPRPADATSDGATATGTTTGGDTTAEDTSANRPKADGATGNLAETGADGHTTYVAIGGAAALALGAAALFASVRRRATHAGRHGR
ncbi:MULTISPECIES: lytic polysaccharide monooxygenase auxiliary activity family 9 protein [unclassified Streptomyces]|uniref:lytic polysaccharide monooxygenase auxiliary activity family 9 protein n=3 Tax=Streptomyces TaxID=1883 RepID=UPI0004C9A28D|nr:MULTISPECIES: lytic polysaccharide monooxygenase [unclassified Streptomyces]